MKSILAIILWCVMLIGLIYGVLAEADLKELKHKNKRAWVKILEETALAEHQAWKEAQQLK